MYPNVRKIEILRDRVNWNSRVNVADNSMSLTVKSLPYGASFRVSLDEVDAVVENLFRNGFSFDIRVRMTSTGEGFSEPLRAELVLHRCDFIPEITTKGVLSCATKTLKQSISRQLWSANYSPSDTDFQKIVKELRI